MVEIFQFHFMYYFRAFGICSDKEYEHITYSLNSGDQLLNKC